MRAEVISIGDEITTGQRLDTNSQWLSQRLTEMGVTVAFHTTVGDELEDNIAAFRTAIGRVDVVVTTGGLGPTADDLTREALADATRTRLVRDAKSLAHIESLFAARRGRPMPERNRVQADFPEGSAPIPNPHGTAPGIAMFVAREGQGPCAFFALPGVPAELTEMWEATVQPRILELSPVSQVTRHRCIKCFGVGESDLEAMLPDLIRRGREPKVGITVSDATITLRITATGPDEPCCLAAMEPTITTIRELLGPLVFGEEDEELEYVVSRQLAQRRQTIAVAEWATAGLISQWLTAAMPDGSPRVKSVVIFSQASLTEFVKSHSLPAGIESHQPEVARAMAEAVREQSRADMGLAVAAYPPAPFTADSRVWVAFATADGTRDKAFGCASHPAILQSRTAKQALNFVRLFLLNQSDVY